MRKDPDWGWSKVPANMAEFEAMMQDLDHFLGSGGLAPAQRPIHAVRHLARWLKYTDPVLPFDRIVTTRVFDKGWLVKNAWEWYERVYKEQVNIDFGPGPVILDIRQTLWRMRMPFTAGEVAFFLDRDLQNQGTAVGGPNRPATLNLLCLIDGLSADLAARLTVSECDHVVLTFNRGNPALVRLCKYGGDDLFEHAKSDYRASIEAMLAGMWAKARWDTAQCAEKLLKGILKLAGKSYPTKGSGGHNIVFLGGLVAQQQGTSLDQGILSSVHCPPKVRYGDKAATRQDALAAHYSLLDVLMLLR